ncbi:MAG: acyclic terpene utilization AtuA family protein [Chloroflexi bacterium]|nr:acyclic terpene utilization AtuA family protein [Chloroflexota bacterium]
MGELRLLSAASIVGYGFAEESFERAIAGGVDLIAADGGSTDPGPYYLGAGKCFTSYQAVKRDLTLMLRAARRLNVPMIVGTAGGSGGAPHVAWAKEILEEIARQEQLHFKLALIHSEPDRDYLKTRVRLGKVTPAGPVGPLTEEATDRAERIVAMMGTEPIAAALDQGADVILAGRTSDAAIFAALPIKLGYDPGLAWHAGKILECASSCALPKAHDCLLVTLRDDHFVVEAPNPKLKCAPIAIATHTLHENESPVLHQESNGVLDTSETRFDPVGDAATRVSASVFRPSDRYTVKLEGVELAGYRTIAIAGTRDPLLIDRIDTYLEEVKTIVAEKARRLNVDPSTYRLIYRVYGHNAVMSDREPTVRSQLDHTHQPSELGLVIEVVAPTQEDATTVLALARTSTLHTDFPGRLCTEGNLAFPYSPSDIPLGPVYRFSVWHAVEPEHWSDLFRIEMCQV